MICSRSPVERTEQNFMQSNGGNFYIDKGGDMLYGEQGKSKVGL